LRIYELEEMIVAQEDERIKAIAMEFDNAIESRNIDAIVEAFAEDCEIELLGIMLSGKEGAHK
jgi:ketosteroid isomerase-like protein